MRLVNRVLEILFRFIIPIGGVLFSGAAIYAVSSGIYSPTDSEDFYTYFLAGAIISLALFLTMLIVVNFTKFRYQWRDWDRQWSGQDVEEDGEQP